MAAVEAKQEESTVAQKMIRDVHQLVYTSLGDIGVPLATTYVSEMVKFMVALKAHQNNQGPMPRVVVGGERDAALGQGHGHMERPSYATMHPPHMRMPRPGPAGTPKGWGSRTPTHGRPEATAVPSPGDLVEFSPGMESFLHGFYQGKS